MKNYEFQISATDKTKAAFNSVNKSLAGVERNATSSGKSVSNLGRNAGQAGVQIQQFIGQVQGGQSALLALSQQGADLGFVLGAPLAGAIIGISSSLVSFLLPSVLDTKSALEQLDEIAETVGATLETAADGTDVFTEAIQRLSNRSEELAKIQIAQTIAELESQISTSSKGISSAIIDIAGISLKTFNQSVYEAEISLQELADQSFDTSAAVDNLGAGGVGKINKVLDAVSFLARRFDITREQAIKLAGSISAFQEDGGVVGIARLRSGIENLNSELGATSPKFTKFASTLLPFFDSTRVGVDRINLLREALGELNPTLEENSNQTDKASNAADRLNTSLQAEVIALESGAQAAEVYSAVQRLLGTEQEAQIPQIIELINKKYALRDAQLASAEAAKKEAQEWSEVEREYAEFIRRMERAEELEESQGESRQRKLENLRLEVEAYQQGTRALEELNAARELGVGATEEEINSYIRLKQQIEDFQQAQRIQTQGYQALLDIAAAYYDGMEGKQAAYARAAIQIGATLLDEEKRTAIASIMSNTYETAMKAYKALAGIPYVGPVLGAAAAAGVITVGGAYAAKVSGIASFDGGGYTGQGARVGGVDGLGGFPAILHPNETVIDHTKGQAMGGMTLHFSPQIIGDFDEMAMRSLQRRSKQFARMVNAATSNSYV